MIQDESQIRARLKSQLEYAMHQMRDEPSKPFQYHSAPKYWDMQEEMVGQYKVGISHAQGRRPTMEDEHLAISFDLTIGNRTYPIELFGIFDGHGGRDVARYARDHLQEYIQRFLTGCNAQGLSDVGVWQALKLATVHLNSELGHLAQSQGTTATIAMILDEKLWTANVGDSRIVLDNHGTPMQLTEDAKPGDVRYQRGIEKRGGFVQNISGVPRVNGCLGVARAIGDHGVGNGISSRAKVTMKPLNEIHPNHQFILCCDGVFDVARTEDIVSAVHEHKNLTVGNLARNITYSAYQAGSTDNLSCLVIRKI